MMQAEVADAFAVAHGETLGVREFPERACGRFGLDRKKYIESRPDYFRRSGY
jgi:GDP-D-mannose dehydratase